MEAFLELKFEAFGRHPLDRRQLNLIEQLNQTFTIMASFAAADHVFRWFPESGGIRLNLGTTPGWDVESIGSNDVHAEVFTAVTPNNNQKLRKDIERLNRSNADNRYVFFYAPGYDPGLHTELEPDDSDVQVWVLGREEVM